MTAPRTATTAPVWSPTVERSVLSVCLRGEAPLRAVMGILGGLDAPFFDETHAEIWEGIKALHAAHKPVDVISVAEAIGRRFDRDEYLADILLNGSPTCHLHNVKFYAKEVYRYAQRRRSMMLSKRNDDAEGRGEHDLAEATRAELGALTMEPPQNEGLPYVQMGDWEALAETPMPWLIDGWLLKGTVTVLGGRGGHGKGLLALALSVSVMTGREVLGGFCPSGAGGVMLLSYEDGAAILARRLRAIVAHHRLDAEGLGAVLQDRLHLLDAPAVLAQLDRSKNVVSTPFYSELLEDARRLKPSMIVVDHLRAAGGGLNGNDPSAMGAVLALLGDVARESGAAVLVLAHLKKGAGEAADPGNIRGAGSVTDEARGSWEIRRTGADVTLSRTKCNHAQEGVSVKLRLVESAGSVCLETAGPVFRDPEMLTPEVVAWFKANPDAHVNPSGVLNGRGKHATDLLASVNAVHPWARPTDITAAIKSLVSSGRLSVQTTRTATRHVTETLALDPDFSEDFDDETPF